MTMKDWFDALDNMIISHQRQILVGSGTISHEEAFEKAENTDIYLVTDDERAVPDLSGHNRSRLITVSPYDALTEVME